jgi:hypothetical protein
MGLALLATVTLIAVPLLDNGRVLLSVVCVGALALGGLIFFAIGALTPSLWLLRIITLGFILQVFWLFLIAISNSPTLSAGNPSAPDIADYPLQAVLPNLLIPLAALVAAFLLSIFRLDSHLPTGIPSILNVKGTDIAPYLVLAALIQFFFWPAMTEHSGLPGYLVRVLSGTFAFVPLVAGRYSRKLSNIHRLWIVSMAINAVIGLVGDSRLVAFMPPALYMIGLISSLRGSARTRMTVFAVVAFIPVLMLSGIVGLVRQDIGRGGIEFIGSERVSQVLNSASRIISPERTATVVEKTSIKEAGLSRLVVWSNIVVPIMSPEMISYRGYDGLGEEALSYAQIAGVSGASLQDLLQAGLFAGPANRYGFTVNKNTSVEWGVLADGWSRGGLMGAFLFGFITVTILMLAEKTIRGSRILSPAATLFLFFVYVKNAYGVLALTLLMTIRSMIIDTGIILVIALFVGAWNMAYSSGRRKASLWPSGVDPRIR